MGHGKSKRRWASRIFLLLLTVMVGAAVYSYLAPTLTAQSVTSYVPYLVESRDVSADMSFGGTVSILYSESITASEGGTVREVYVQSSQTVAKGDKLLQLEDGTMMTAGINGVVNQMRVAAGRYMPANMTLVQICDLTHMQISMNVDEYDISNVYIGQPCTVYILSLGLSFDTEIAHINRVSSASGTVAYYTVGVELTVPEEVLPGMQASVTIPQESVKDVPALPVEAISFESDGSAYVYTKNGDSYRKTPVTVGLNDGMYAQLTDGLFAGDTAYATETVETAGAGIDLTALYKQAFGEKIVITAGERARGDRAASGGEAALNGGLPEGMPEGIPQSVLESMPESIQQGGDTGGQPDIGQASVKEGE